MPLTTEVTPAEMGEAMRLNRTRMYWFIACTNSWYVIAPLIIILWVDIAALTHGGPFLPASLGLILLLGFFLWFDWYWSLEAVKKHSAQSRHRKGSLSFDEKGLFASYASGATAFVPWSEFSGWKEGAGVFTLTLKSRMTFSVLTKRGLSEPELEQLRSLFRSRLADASTSTR